VIRIAFTILGGKGWLGGRHYLVNLLRSLRAYEAQEVTPVLFVSDRLAEEDVAPLRSIDGVEIVASAHFSAERRTQRILQALLWGQDSNAVRLFRAHRIDVVFEPAQFYGWRLPMPAVAWVPDFQDRHLPHMFSRKAHVQKWVGQWIQTLTGRTFMLSSEDSRSDCERFYPPTRGRTRVVRFAVPAPRAVQAAELAEVLRLHGLPEQFFFLPNQLWAHKNHICVVKALKILEDGGHRAVVAVTGNSQDMRHRAHFDSLMREVSESGLAESFRFLGVVPYEHVLALMQGAAALINPSRCEGWSTTVEEAKSSGTPMILSSLPVHREQAGENALYFSPDSPHELARLLQSFRPLSREERAAAATKARIESGVRLAQFARDFYDVMNESLQGNRRGVATL
jgi:glycosyltransferase involved in cell wall biosynthesis